MYRQKIFRAETKVADAKAGRIEAAVSDETPDRGGDVIRQDGWDLGNFQRHPVLLASHDYMHLRAQIGEWESMEVRGKRLVGVARYYIGEGNADADWGFNLAAKGRAAYSVGFMNLESKDREDGGLEFLRQELLEVSHVTIPANANALQLMMKSHLDPTISALIEEQLAETVGDAVSRAGRVMSQANLDKLHRVMGSLGDIHGGVCDMGEDCPMEGKAWLPAHSHALDAWEFKGPIPPHRTPLADENAAWDAGAEVRAAEGAAQLRRMHAWVDSDGDDEAKGSYKLPHHRAGGECVWRGVAAAMGALMGARGGVDIPEDDQRGVYNHLRRHYEQFDKAPPELAAARTYGAALLERAEAVRRDYIASLSHLSS